jgi:peptide/nickel transport system permease protein
LRAYITRRLFLIIPTLFIASLIIFFMLRLIPGDIIDQMVGEHGAVTGMDREAVEHAMGLDVPIWKQYLRWLGVMPYVDDAQVLIEDDPEAGRQQLVITRLPEKVKKDAVVEEIDELIADNTVTGISDLRDESDVMAMRIVIELEREAQPEQVRDSLYKHTAMRKSEFGGLLQGNLGTTLWKRIPVTQELFARWPVTFELGLLAIIIGLTLAIPIGIFSAIRQDSAGDYMGRSFSILCLAVPAFWIGTMVMIFPAKWWGWSPPIMLIKFTDDPLGNLGQFIIPALIMGLGMSGTTMRMTRSMMLEVLRQDYIRTAWSKGLKERLVVTRHALKNALIPVITIIGFMMPVLIGGSVIMEQIFALPGVGRLMIDAINQRDYPIVSGVMIFTATWVLLINLVVDITYSFLDPRVQYR